MTRTATGLGVRTARQLAVLAEALAAPERPVTLVFADRGYVEVLLNWLVAADVHGTRPVVCALDDPLDQWLSRKGIPSVRVPWDGTVPGIWETRLRVLRHLLAEGVDLIHSDADAVWMEDPRPDVAAGGDLVASQGTVWPPDALAAMGAVVCCGFFGLRATDGTRALLDDVWGRLGEDPIRDDQAALNRALAAAGATWTVTRPPVARAEVAGHAVPLFDHDLEGSASGISLRLLAHTRYQRVPLDHPAAVIHHLSEKTAESKRAELRAAGAYVLADDWASIGFSGEALDRLRAVPAATAG